MTVRVEDLKRQDIVTVEYYVSDLKDDRAWLTPLPGAGWNMVGNITIGVNDEALAALNAEKVVRARPVRWGQEMAETATGRPVIYLGTIDNAIYLKEAEGRAAYFSLCSGRYTHADGSPINWEASE